VHGAPVIIFVGLLVFLAHLFVALFERTRVPDVLYLILIGVVIGPVLQIVTPEDFGKLGPIFTTIALVVILFEGGLELSLETLRTSFRGTVIITLVSYLLAFALLSIPLLLIGFLPVPLALFTAAVLAGPAPAVVIPIIRQLALSPSSRTTLMLESPLGEALCIVIALAFIDSVRYEAFQVGPLIGRLLSSFLFALLIGGVGGFVWSLLLHKMRQLRYAILTTPAFLFILYGITEFLGFSGPVSALTFGITLGNAGIKEIPWLSERYNLTPLVHNEVEKSFFGEVVFIIKTFFFVYLGLSIRFTDPWILVLALGLSLLLLASRIVSIRIAASQAQTPRSDAAMMSIMIPKGTAAAVLAAIPIQMGFAHADFIQNTIYAVVITSTVGTALLIFLLEQKALSWFTEPLFGSYPANLVALPETEPATVEAKFSSRAEVGPKRSR
jgi:cell volume regulation protein A